MKREFGLQDSHLNLEFSGSTDAPRVASATHSFHNQENPMAKRQKAKPACTATIGFEAGSYAFVVRPSSFEIRPVLWSDPVKVPAMAFEMAKCDDLAGKWAKTKQLAAFPADGAAKTANFHVEGLLKQLNSTPLEIRVANLCYESCPSLRDMQAASFTAHLRQISEVFSPKIKALAPPDAFQKNVAMNAALALNWARLSGSRLCLLPYESTGSRMKAECRRMKGSPVLDSSFFLLPFPAIRRAHSPN